MLGSCLGLVDVDLVLRRTLHAVGAHGHERGVLRGHAEELVARFHELVVAEACPVLEEHVEPGGVAEVDDGRRGLVFDGVVRAGQTLQLDGARGAALLDGEDVTPYTLGEFPRITPGGTALTYKGDPVGPHAATVTVAYRHRWW